jgi:N utilization substance protein A
MTKELCHVIDQISREKGISKEILIEALESALLSAMRKKYGGRSNIFLSIDRQKCNITLYETKTVVADVQNPFEEISVKDAKAINPEKNEGDTVEFPLDLHDLGRIAAQTAKRSYSRGSVKLSVMLSLMISRTRQDRSSAALLCGGKRVFIF